MTYALVAYGIVAVALLAYGAHLQRERRGLRRSLGPAGAAIALDKGGSTDV